MALEDWPLQYTVMKKRVNEEWRGKPKKNPPWYFKVLIKTQDTCCFFPRSCLSFVVFVSTSKPLSLTRPTRQKSLRFPCWAGATCSVRSTEEMSPLVFVTAVFSLEGIHQKTISCSLGNSIYKRTWRYEILDKQIQQFNAYQTFADPPIAGSWLASPVKKRMNMSCRAMSKHLSTAFVCFNSWHRDTHWVACNAAKNVVRMVDGSWGYAIQCVHACYL